MLPRSLPALVSTPTVRKALHCSFGLILASVNCTGITHVLLLLCFHYLVLVEELVLMDEDDVVDDDVLVEELVVEEVDVIVDDVVVVELEVIVELLVVVDELLLVEEDVLVDDDELRCSEQWISTQLQQAAVTPV